MAENGTPCKVTELFVVDAINFTECEQRVSEYVAHLVSGGFEVLTESHAPYGEIFFSDKEDEEKFYRVRLSVIMLDERSGKEKRTKAVYLVQGKDIESAKGNLDEVLRETMMQYVVEGVHETAVQGVVNA